MLKLKSEAYPYPVLTNHEEGDYENSIFDSNITLDIQDNENDNSDLKINYEFILENKDIQALIDKGDADFAILVISGTTGFREIYFTNKKIVGSILINLSDIYGKVEFIPQIIITSDMVYLKSDDFNSEYKLGDEDPKFRVYEGDTVAISDNFVKYLSFEPLTLQSMIQVNLDVSLDPKTYSIDTSHQEYLTVNMGETFHEKWQNEDMRKLLMSSVIKDAILFALREYLEDKDQVDNKKWASLIVDKFNDILEDENDLKNDLDKMNQIALQIAAKYTINKVTDIEEE